MLSGPLFEQLEEFQRNAVRFSMKARTAALFFEQGTGKTWISGGIIEALWLKLTNAFSALVVVPLANYESTWVKFLSGKLPGIRLSCSVDEFIAGGCRGVLLLHYEALSPRLKQVRKLSFSIIIYDEAHRLKDRSSLQSRTASKLTDCADRRVILTGTPIEKEPSDLWAQFRFLAPGVLGSWKHFQSGFMTEIDLTEEKRKLAKARPGSVRYQFAMRDLMIKQRQRRFDFDRLPQLAGLIKPYALRVSKEDALPDLPELRVVPSYVRLRGRQRMMYDLMRRQYVIDLPGSPAPIQAKLKATQRIKLHQIAGGYVIDDDGRVVICGKAKLRRCWQLIRRHVAQTPVVVFCHYTAEVHALVSELSLQGYVVAAISGEVKPRDRSLIVEAFQQRRIDVLVCQISSGGVGLDLYAASVAILFSFRHSSIVFDQALARIHRRGQEKNCIVYLIIAENTVDFGIYVDILDKQRKFGPVLQSLKRRQPMATKTKTKTQEKVKEAPAAKSATKAEETMPFGVTELAEALGIKEASARVRLRDAGVEKAGKSYGWPSQKAFDAVVKQLKAGSAPAANDDKPAAAKTSKKKAA